MTRVTRRTFLNQVGSAALVVAPGRAVGTALGGVGTATPPEAAQGTAAAKPVMYDLLIRGGRVIDPSQNISAVRDVAIAGSRIARVAADIPAASARQVYDATGKMVTPGLIDMHTHVYKHGITLNVDSDIVGVGSGVTTVLDCGSTGAGTFQGFRKYVIDGAATRIYALLNISTIGLVVTNEIYLDPKMIDARAAIRTIGANRDRILGVKVRVNGKHSDLAHDIEVLKVAREVADATDLPIMMHWSVEPELLAILKAGDILAHPFNPPSVTSANLFGADGQQAGTVLPQILALKDRGIWTDGQLGTTHHSWDVSEKAVKQGWYPDAITTDISRAPDGGPASVLVPMSEFLHLGMPLERIIAGVTSTPAAIMKFPEKVGTLAEGTTADVAVLDLVSGTFPFADSTRTPRSLAWLLGGVARVTGGVFLKGAPPAPAAAAPVPANTAR